MIIAPSILSMDFSKVNESIQQINESEAKWVHFDVMDGHFVNNLTFGPDVLRGICRLTPLFLDVHLMIERPQDYAEKFVVAGADQITVHIECFDSMKELRSFITELKKMKVKVGLTSKPSTPMNWIYECIRDIDMVLIMSVEPGFGGQAFMMEALEKIKKVDELRDKENHSLLIQVDGGINQETAKLAKEAGADVLVAGSYIFKGDIKERVKSLL